MCGIAGVLGPPERTSHLITQMLQAVTHRGPNDRGEIVEPALALGATRLSIRDIEGGHQPMSTPDGRVTVAYNGEIYNASELEAGPLLRDSEPHTRCDTETILRLYAAGGHAKLPELFRSLRGMFAAAIYDTARSRLVLARDPFGIKPLHYRLSSDGAMVAFASEIKSLLVDPECPREINRDALVNYLSLQYNPLDETFFTGIFRLPPGSYATVDLPSGRMEVHSFWTFTFDDTAATDEQVLTTEVRTAMTDSVACHLISDVPVGAFLSGGIDSAIIATLAQEHRLATGLGPLKTFTLGFEERSEFDEAREVADRIGSEHHEVTVTSDDFVGALPDIAWYFDEPVADPSAIPIYFLSRAAREHVRVVLSGEGADELFGGYRIYGEPLMLDRVRRLPRPVRALAARLARSPISFRGRNYLRRATTPLEDRYFGGSTMAPGLGGFGTFAPEDAARLLKAPAVDHHFRPPGHALAATTSGFAELPEARRMQLIDIRYWLGGDILAKADRMSMAASLELRVPFLDINVARTAARVPDSLKYREGTTKWLLRRAFHRVVPESTQWRAKLGFPTPLREWITRDPDAMLAPLRRSTLLHELVDMTYVEELAAKHTRGEIDASRRFLLLLMLAAWLEAFMQGDVAVPPSQRSKPTYSRTPANSSGTLWRQVPADVDTREVMDSGRT